MLEHVLDKGLVLKEEGQGDPDNDDYVSYNVKPVLEKWLVLKRGWS